MDELLKTFMGNLKTPMSELWEKNKIFLVFFFVLIVVVKFHEVIFAFLIEASKKLMEQSTKQDHDLSQVENKANNLANELVDQSKKLDENKPTVDEDWFKK